MWRKERLISLYLVTKVALLSAGCVWILVGGWGVVENLAAECIRKWTCAELLIAHSINGVDRIRSYCTETPLSWWTLLRSEIFWFVIQLNNTDGYNNYGAIMRLWQFPFLRDFRFLQQCWWSWDLLGLYALSTCNMLATFWRGVLPSSSKPVFLYDMQLEKKAVRSSKTSVTIYQSALCNIPEDLNLHCISGDQAERRYLWRDHRKWIFMKALTTWKVSLRCGCCKGNLFVFQYVSSKCYYGQTNSFLRIGALLVLSLWTNGSVLWWLAYRRSVASINFVRFPLWYNVKEWIVFGVFRKRVCSFVSQRYWRIFVEVRKIPTWCPNLTRIHVTHQQPYGQRLAQSRGSWVSSHQVGIQVREM
jgi:hypothetical protein